MISLLLINTLGSVDSTFLIIVAAIIAIAVGIYFLIPVLNKAQYRDQREQLRKREEAFNANKTTTTQPEQNSQELNEKSPIADSVESDV